MIMIHHYDHAYAALTVAMRLGLREVMFHSPPAAAAYGATEYFNPILQAARTAFPALKITFILDCGPFPAFIFGALRAGFKHIRFTGEKELAQQLLILAESYQARILTTPLEQPYLDAEEAANLYQACETWFKAQV